MIKTVIKKILLLVFYLIATPVLVLLTFAGPKNRSQLVWGPVPMTNNKYWSAAVKTLGYNSVTLMEEFYHIQYKDDFDLYFTEMVPDWIRPKLIRHELTQLIGYLYVIRHASVLHLSFLGGPLWNTWLRKIEGPLYKLAGVKTVVLPFGGDVYMYSRIMDPCVRHGLLLSFPHMAVREREIKSRVEHWVRYADVIVMGFTIDGVPRWDALVGNMICIDIDQWRRDRSYSDSDGVNECVKILHAPNRRGVKGTEFILKAVDELKAEGLLVELILLEKVPNEEIRETMQEADILVDQLIMPGYGLFAVEGMASGLPVLANLEQEMYTQLFRRFSYLGLCPIVSSSPESVKENLKALITNPGLRNQLGHASRQYAENYHSYKTSAYLFGSIYDQILNGQEVDLQNLFNPHTSEYVAANPVDNPLIDNHLPKAYRSPVEEITR